MSPIKSASAARRRLLPPQWRSAAQLWSVVGGFDGSTGVPAGREASKPLVVRVDRGYGMVDGVGSRVDRPVGDPGSEKARPRSAQLEVLRCDLVESIGKMQLCCGGFGQVGTGLLASEH